MKKMLRGGKSLFYKGKLLCAAKPRTKVARRVSVWACLKQDRRVENADLALKWRASSRRIMGLRPLPDVSRLATVGGVSDADSHESAGQIHRNSG